MKTTIQLKKSRVIVIALIFVMCVVSFFAYSSKPKIGSIKIIDAQNAGVEGIRICASFHSRGFSDPVYTNKRGEANLGLKSYQNVASISINYKNIKQGIGGLDQLDSPHVWPLKLRFHGDSFELY